VDPPAGPCALKSDGAQAEPCARVSAGVSAGVTAGAGAGAAGECER